MASARAMMKKTRYVAILPCCELLVVVTRGRLRDVRAFGPVFSSHVWSIVWLAITWPKIRLSLGGSRWMIAGKNPSMLEKW